MDSGNPDGFVVVIENKKRRGNMNNQIPLHMRNQIKPDPEVVNKLMETLEEMQSRQEQKRYYGRVRGIAMAAVTLVFVLFMMNSQIGKTLAENIKSWLVPKQVEETLEGNVEETEMEPSAQEREQENEADYVIYVNEDVFTTEKNNGIQTIKAIADTETKMIIYQIENCGIEECLESLKKEKGDKEYQEAEPLEIGVAYEGVLYAEGIDWDDVITRIYCIDNGKGGCFVVEYSNIIEADEGFGSRFHSMLNTFEIIDMKEE